MFRFVSRVLFPDLVLSRIAVWNWFCFLWQRLPICFPVCSENAGPYFLSHLLFNLAFHCVFFLRCILLPLQSFCKNLLLQTVSHKLGILAQSIWRRSLVKTDWLEYPSWLIRSIRSNNSTWSSVGISLLHIVSAAGVPERCIVQSG